MQRNWKLWMAILTCRVKIVQKTGCVFIAQETSKTGQFPGFCFSFSIIFCIFFLSFVLENGHYVQVNVFFIHNAVTSTYIYIYAQKKLAPFWDTQSRAARSSALNAAILFTSFFSHVIDYHN